MVQHCYRVYMAEILIDLGGTNTKLGWISKDENFINDKTLIKTEAKLGPKKWVESVYQYTKRIEDSISHIWVASPGPIDLQRGVLIDTPNLQEFNGFELKEALEKRFGAEVKFENDANCAALAEYYYGKYKGTSYLVALTLGTGLGSGVINDGRLIVGSRGQAVEFGHTVVNPTMAQEFFFDGSLEKYIGSGSVGDIENLFNSPSDRATSWTKAVAIAVYNVVMIFNPSVVVLAGGAAAAWSKISKQIQRELKNSLPRLFHEGLIVDATDLDEWSGLYGALGLRKQCH